MENGITQVIDPNVELLADIPIPTVEEDLFDGKRLAVRLVELAVTAPVVAPRVVALTGKCGVGKSSIVNMASAIVGRHPDVAMVSIDAQQHGSAHSLMSQLASDLDKLFSELGVVEERDKVRAALVSYGGLVSGLVRLAGVKVDVSSVLARSAASLRADIARNLEETGKRLVIIMDHLDYLPPAEIGGAFAALRMYAEIPYVAIVIAVDRHELATRVVAAGLDSRAFERLVHVELVMPPTDRAVLARVMVGGLERVAARTRRDLAPAMALFDLNDGVGLGLIDTPRDAKRVCNALAAALPLLSPDANAYLASLELVLDVLVPELDVQLAVRARDATDRGAAFAELASTVSKHPRAVALRPALRVLVVGD